MYGLPAQETGKHRAKFGWPPVSDVAAVTKPRRETRWNLLGCPKLANWYQPLVCRFRKFLHCWKAYEICYKNSCDISHLTLGMLLHCFGKFKIHILYRCERKRIQIAFLIVSNFIIHPHILICSVFKIASLSPHWLQIKFSMFFYLFPFAINLWHRKFVTADITQCLSTINIVFSDKDNILIKEVCIWRGTQQRGWQTNFLRKAGQNVVCINKGQIPLRYLARSWFEARRRELRTSFEPDSVMEFSFKLLKKLRDLGTVDRRPGSSRPRCTLTEENAERVNDLVFSQEDKPQPRDCPWDITEDGYLSVHSKCNLFTDSLEVWNFFETQCIYACAVFFLFNL